jgi:hypothetical protein
MNFPSPDFATSVTVHISGNVPSRRSFCHEEILSLLTSREISREGPLSLGPLARVRALPQIIRK